MEHLVRVLNERDRRTLAWLRTQVGDAALTAAAERCGGPAKPYVSSVCRYLGVTAPQFSGARLHNPTATAEESLALIRQILTDRNRSASLHRSEPYPRAKFNRT
ncbi:hypothetical protein LMG28614_06844 [Paraburkholderia ultramafica]|uniref:Uncharacterized protein n=1 Tax=Paraburkholderia ultramafica TaxID=1544867 RepID=A0A6S7BYL9_9BURK|nr:hypothetical protein [Paraburkholderia ultramafica]CAB3808594.1 hypothetical protein LMG28614_06844 [Paraburkholderia ultramafica]